MELTIPELTAVHIGLLALALVVGLVLGWVFRGERSAKEKIAVSAGWQDQLESQQAENDRLSEQNKSLMEQISKYQNSQDESLNRARELSGSLKESFQRRDELQRQLGEFRSKLQATVAQRDKLKAALEKQEAANKSTATGLREKDDKIFNLSRELNSWQSRVPPLVEKFQQRDKQARELEDELEKMRKTIESYEEMLRTNQTRIEPVQAGSLDGLDASNEPHSDTTAANILSNLQDQVDNTRDDVAQLEAAPEVSDAADVTAFAESPESAETPGSPDIAEVRDEPDVAETAEASFMAETGAESDVVEADEAPEASGSDESVQADATDELLESAEDLIAADIFVSDTDQAEVDAGAGKTTRRILEEDAAQADDKDDLKQIKGVGPAIEKTLNDLGIFSFNQIAQMSEHEIDRVAQRVKGFRSRIYRQNWIGQARDLHYQKINNRP